MAGSELPQAAHNHSPRGRAGTALSLPDEAALVAQARSGDLPAFEYLVALYQGRLFRLAYRMLRDRGDAEDVVQDTLTAGWRMLPTLDRGEAFGGWVYRTATNRCLDVLRHRTAHPQDLPGTEHLAAALDAGATRRGADPHHSAEVSAELETLRRALSLLPADQRACWLLREVHGQSYAEIGAALRISPPAVRGRLARAREHLTAAMTQWR
ncbi:MULTISPECIES: RNA polymerase sigma factor [unclassified Arthrobacter]|uniref:RNA polymerase sigma factor n=1 Tax=unclassified Arthrobacter TaxID=235627 RepID=UPI001D14AE55|nr:MULTISPECIES: RNA polymerase sigma factor [unclassified Arthrobacter]MCC3275462.1 RNA polymerase sigma factor [Arthrobacter sp. zg-Y20]MCC3278532.1 RNA polymerase sigma factor [Arthrobacter sp. zg-Y40]MCC9176903.1 RNA polymerase sigma factor [Arthrobacter sp. zg-Y750]MDK1315619.1 RNA polymerase sigma factor [Arthrobacter sp. zg.Y20]MDK1326389.1 RNA polymerase sigma factor [Arthrobacter sp. zg-Y1143]